jgi:hypothetical protein
MTAALLFPIKLIGICAFLYVCGLWLIFPPSLIMGWV